MTWLERDDETALCVKQRWQSRAMRRAQMYDDYIDHHFADSVEFYERMIPPPSQRAWDDDSDFGIVLPIFATDELYAAALVASLTVDPPRIR